VLVNGLGDFAAASGVDGQDCDGASLISLEELGDFDPEEAVPFLNSMDELRPRPTIISRIAPHVHNK